MWTPSVLIAVAGIGIRRFSGLSYKHIILYDGKCAMCNQLVSFILDRDKHGKFAFASLQSQFAHELLSRHGQNADELNTFYCVVDYDTEREILLSRAEGGVFLLSQLGGIYAFANGLRFIPLPLLNAGYDLIARNRYKWFGRYDTCRLPEPQWASRFIDADVSS